MSTPATPRLERIDSVCFRTGLSRSGIYRLIKAGEFPANISLAGRSRCWNAADIDAWIQDRINQSTATPKTTTGRAAQ